MDPLLTKLEFPQELSKVHNTFHVSNLKKCYANEPLAVPLDRLHFDDKLHFVEEPIEIIDREVKRLKRSRIPLVKVRWNSKRGPEFTWEREDQFKKKYPHLFTKTASSSSAASYYSHLDCATARHEPFMSILISPGMGKLLKNFKDDDYPHLVRLPFLDQTMNLIKHLFSKEIEYGRSKTNEVRQTHISHQHPLILVDTTEPTTSTLSCHNPMKKVELICNGCLRPIMDSPFYTCADEDEHHCNFALNAAMERLGSDELISIYEKLHKRHDRESFSQVSKNFLKARYSSSEENLDHAADYEFDFDDEGLCAVANACGHLYDVKLSGRLHVGDLGVVSLVRSLRNLRHLELARCLEYLANGDLKNCLKYLYLAECVRISDAAKIQNIKTLRLCWLINVSDTSMFEIASNCLKLNRVDLAGCETITSEGLRALAYLPKLSNLRLHSCHNISWEDVTYIGIDQRCNLYGTTPIPSFFHKANKRLSGLDNLPERLRKGSSFLSDETVGKSCEHAAAYGVGYLVSALGVWVLGKLGIIDHDPFVWETAKKYLPAAFVFYLTIFTNTNLLRHANVDMFIVFRALTPLLVAVADVLFRKQEVPSKFTFLSLVVILCGSVGYVATDSGFSLTTYSSAFAYLVTIMTEMVYFKHVVTNLRLNTWGFVLLGYNG
ncbi:GDP-fucose transporter 1 [Tanacetum coccineum]